MNWLDHHLKGDERALAYEFLTHYSKAIFEDLSNHYNAPRHNGFEAPHLAANAEITPLSDTYFTELLEHFESVGFPSNAHP